MDEMRALEMRFLGLVFVLLAACGSKAPEVKNVKEPVATGKTCTTSDECADGELCAGPAGCGIAWTCVPQRPCTRDLVIFCSCEGKTVQGSGSCPPEPYQHAGSCD
jgi:hypothetical protein